MSAKTAVYANHVRAYSLKAHGTNMLGSPVHPEHVCYFEQRGGDLKFLLALTPDRDGRVREMDFDRAVINAYGAMSGEDVTAIHIFGISRN